MIGAVLAGGRGRRLGGAGKATVELAGTPLVEHAIAALRAGAGLAEVVVVAKPGTPLPPGLDVPVWHDDAPPGDHHPRHGIVRALRGAAGAPVLVLAVDLPLVPRAVLVALRDAGGTAVARDADGLQPLCAVYAAAALAPLATAPPGEPLRRTVAALGPRVVEVEGALLNVNTPEDLAAAEARLGAA